MVHHAHFERVADAREIASELDIGLAGPGAAGRMIVRQEKIPRSGLQSPRYDGPKSADDYAFKTACDEQLFDEMPLLIEEQNKELF